MAECTKTPVIKDVDGPDAHLDPAAVKGEAEPVPQRPAWMHAEPTKAAKQRRSRDKSLAAGPSAKPNQAGDAGMELTPSQLIKDWLSSAAATGYGISFLLHLLMLLAMAVWIVPQLVEATSVTTVVESDVEAPQPFDAVDDVRLEIPAGSDNFVLPQLTEAFPEHVPLKLLEYQFLRDVTTAETHGENGSSGNDGGFRLVEPKNAVKAGSFSAWTIPIAQRVGEPAKAGDEPRPGQDYHIVIQVKVPGDRNVYRISDLSGRVIGTDGYVQVIPAQAYFQEEDGSLTRAKLGRRLPIIDGVVQILIRVPGAEALVKDTILVKSKQLKEEQTLELVFGRAAGNGLP